MNKFSLSASNNNSPNSSFQPSIAEITSGTPLFQSKWKYCEKCGANVIARDTPSALCRSCDIIVKQDTIVHPLRSASAVAAAAAAAAAAGERDRLADRVADRVDNNKKRKFTAFLLPQCQQLYAHADPHLVQEQKVLLRKHLDHRNAIELAKQQVKTLRESLATIKRESTNKVATDQAKPTPLDNVISAMGGLIESFCHSRYAPYFLYPPNVLPKANESTGVPLLPKYLADIKHGIVIGRINSPKKLAQEIAEMLSPFYLQPISWRSSQGKKKKFAYPWHSAVWIRSSQAGVIAEEFSKDFEKAHTDLVRKFQQDNGIVSQFRGVYYRVEKKRWRARITCGGKKYDLGLFMTADAAARAYDSAARQFHGDSARLNFPHEGVPAKSRASEYHPQ